MTRWRVAVVAALLACDGGAGPGTAVRDDARASVPTAADVQALAQLHRQTMELRALRDEYAELSRMDPCWTPGEPRPPSPPAPGPLPTSPDAVAAELAATRAAIDDWNARRAVCAEVAKAATGLVEAQAANEVATAVDLTTLPALGPTPRTSKLEVHAADVDLDTLLMALDGGSIMRVADDAKVTGVLRAATAHDAALTLAGRSPTKAITSFRGGGRALRLAFADAPAADLWRLVAMVQRLNVFLVADAPATTVVANGVGAEAFASGLAALHGQTIDKARRDVWVVRATDGPALDPALMQLGDARVTLDSVSARFGELLAALRALGVAALGAPCLAGAPIPWVARQAPVGPVVAAMALRAATTPTADAGCELPALATPTLANRPVALVAVGDRRAAIVEAAGGHALLLDAPTGATWRLTEQGVAIGDQLVALAADAWPHRATPLPAPSSADEAGAPLELERLFEIGRLAATIVRAKDSRAVFQRPDGKWQVVPGPNDPPTMWTPKIEPGRVTYPTQVPGKPSGERVILLHAQ